MILIDSNIFMYAAGAESRFKAPSTAFLDRVAVGEVKAAIDTEVLQEILYRYRKIGEWERGGQLFDQTLRLVSTVFPVTKDIVLLARQLMNRFQGLGAQDAIHAAVVLSEGLEGICSFDSDFDQIPEVQRLEPPL